MKFNDLQLKMIDDVKTGGGFVDWLKKYKNELGFSAAALGSILAAIAARKYVSNRTRRAYESANPLDVAASEQDVEIMRGSGFSDWLKKHKTKLGISAAALAAILGAIGARKYVSDRTRRIYESAGQPIVQGQDIEFMQGDGKIKDFLKKHKTKIGVAGSLAALLGSIGAAVALNRRDNKNKAAAEAAADPSRDYERVMESVRSNPALEEEEEFNPRSLVIRGSGRKCKCGKCCKKIMKSIGGEGLASMMMQHPKVGYGILDDLSKLAHKGITEGFNFIGENSLIALIEIAVALLGEESRPFVTNLILKFGLKGLSFIKKYAHKGVTWIKKNVKKLDEPKKGKGMMCPHCKPFFMDEFVKGNIRGADIVKMGGNFANDLGNATIWFSKNLLAPALRIVPGSLGEAMAYGPEHLDKIAELTSPGYEYEDPITDKHSKPSYYGAYVKPTKQPTIKTKSTKITDVTAKPFISGGKKSFIDKLIELVPTRLISSLISESVRAPIKKDDKKEGAKEGTKEGTKKGGKKSKTDILVKLIPWDLLKQIFKEVLDIPSYSILPRRFLSDGEKSIWGNGFRTRLGPEGYPIKPPGIPPSITKKPIKLDRPKPRSGGRKMLPNPFSPDGLPDEETPAHILPYPFNPDQPTQDPNMNEQVITIPENNNQDYKSFKVGMKRIGKGNIKSKKPKKKVTKKAIMKKLQFAKNT